MSLTTDELVQKLSESLASLNGRGKEEWRRYIPKAVEHIVVLDIIFDAVERDGKTGRAALKVVNG